MCRPLTAPPEDNRGHYSILKLGIVVNHYLAGLREDTWGHRLSGIISWEVAHIRLTTPGGAFGDTFGTIIWSHRDKLRRAGGRVVSCKTTVAHSSDTKSLITVEHVCRRAVLRRTHIAPDWAYPRWQAARAKRDRAALVQFVCKFQDYF